MYLLRCSILIVLSSLSALPAAAQIDNGDFEMGFEGWTLDQPETWAWNIRAEGEGGLMGDYAQAQSPFGDSGGTACISQEFECGTANPEMNCRIQFSFRLQQIDASDGTGRVHVRVDGEDRFTSASATVGWGTESVTTTCGLHTLALCLTVDSGNNGWDAGFDNVSATCEPIVPVSSPSWSRIKALYRR